MTETSIAQINARIAHLRLVYGDADQDAALLEALLKEREEAKEGWHVVMPNLDQIGGAAAANGGIDTGTEAVTELLTRVKGGNWAFDPRFSTIVAGEKCIAEVFTSDADARFIAAARDLIPALLAERDEARAEVERLKAQPVTVHDAARVVADRLADGEVWRVAVNGAAAILNSGMPEEYWTTVRQIRETLDAALRAIAEGDNAKAD